MKRSRDIMGLLSRNQVRYSKCLTIRRAYDRFQWRISFADSIRAMVTTKTEKWTGKERCSLMS